MCAWFLVTRRGFSGYVPSFTVAFRVRPTTRSWHGGPSSPAPARRPLVCPRRQILLVCRMVSVALNNINDCDEVFNYWEPLHEVLYGYGFQVRRPSARPAF